MTRLLRCRVEVSPGGECFSPGGICGQDAAVGLITPFVPENVQVGLLDPKPVLQLRPICAEHVEETVHHVQTTMSVEEWALVPLMYGTAKGALT